MTVRPIHHRRNTKSMWLIFHGFFNVINKRRRTKNTFMHTVSSLSRLFLHSVCSNWARNVGFEKLISRNIMTPFNTTPSGKGRPKLDVTSGIGQRPAIAAVKLKPGLVNPSFPQIEARKIHALDPRCPEPLEISQHFISSI